MAAHRERLRAAGRAFVNADLPVEVVEAIDQLKAVRGISSRSAVIEEALRLYIENAEELRA